MYQENSNINDRKKKVIIFANNDIWLYKLRKEVIKSLLKEGYEVTISCPDGSYIQTMVGWGCVFIETTVDRRGTNPFNDFRLLINYIKVLKNVKPDIVLTYTIKPNLYGGLACRLLGIKCINNITGLGSGFNKNIFLKSSLIYLYKVSLKKSTCIFFQNGEDMKILLDARVVKGCSELIPGSGVNLEEYKVKEFPQDENASFIFIGRIMKDKGIDEYLEASKIIKQEYPKVEFRIVGFVEETQSHYKKVLKEYEEDGNISFLGYQENVQPIIQKSHCIIQASHGGEGLSNVLLETGAMGRALIASNIPGCRETVDEGVNGFTFEKKDTKSLVDKIKKFIELPTEEKRRMGLNSREKVKREFDREIVVEAYMNVIKKNI